MLPRTGCWSNAFSTTLFLDPDAPKPLHFLFNVMQHARPAPEDKFFQVIVKSKSTITKYQKQRSFFLHFVRHADEAVVVSELDDLGGQGAGGGTGSRERKFRCKP